MIRRQKVLHGVNSQNALGSRIIIWRALRRYIDVGPTERGHEDSGADVGVEESRDVGGVARVWEGS